MLNADGTVHSEARHYPYGVERWSSGTLPTDYRFTRQRSEAGLGLVHMGARFYDPALGRWISADTLVPEPGNPQDLNRYSYVRNSPLVYIDPSGHKSRKQWEDEFRDEHGEDPTDQDWWDYQFSLQIEDWTAAAWLATYATRQAIFAAGVTIRVGYGLTNYDGTAIDTLYYWKLSEVMEIGQAISNIAQVFGNNARHVIGGALIMRTRTRLWPLGGIGTRCRGYELFGTVYMNDSAFDTPGRAEHVLTHELGHYLQESQGLFWNFKRARSQVFPNRFARENGVAEDFAASFEIYVFESIGRPVIERGRTLTVDQSRRGFFSQFVYEHRLDRQH